jgi:hypothetical protein
MSRKTKFKPQPKVSEMKQDANVEIQESTSGVVQEDQKIEQVTTNEVVAGEEQVAKEVIELIAVKDIPVQEKPTVQESAPINTVAEKEKEVSPYSEGLTKLLDLCKQTKNVSLINYVNELLDYAQKMAPDQTMTRELGAANQAAFYNTLVCIIDHTGKDFRLGFATMLAIFNEYKKGAFSGTHVLRFMEDVPLNKNKRDAFIKMVNLFSMTADSKTRKAALKHVDLKRELTNGVSDEGKARIASFYSV